MSRSILKSSEGRREIPANEGNQSLDYSAMNAVKPWSHVDEQPMVMHDVHAEISRIHENLERMHLKMMENFPKPPNPFEPMAPLLMGPPQIPPEFHEPFPPNMLMPPTHAQWNGSAKPEPLLAIRDSSSPCGSLKRRPRDVMQIDRHSPNAFANHPDFENQQMMILTPSHMASKMPESGFSPVFTEDEYGNKIMELTLDVTGFLPEDIHIHTEKNILFVHARRLSAKRDVMSQGGFEEARVAKECRRQYVLPEVIRADNLRCYVNRKGQLTIEGPLGPEIMRKTNKKKVKFVPGQN